MPDHGPAQEHLIGRLINGAKRLAKRIAGVKTAFMKLPTPLFLAAVAAGLAAAGFVMARGLSGIADVRDAAAERSANARASSPWPYGVRVDLATSDSILPTASAGNTFWVFLREDSLDVGRSRGESCASLSAIRDAVSAVSGIRVRYVMLSDATGQCADAVYTAKAVALVNHDTLLAPTTSAGAPPMRWALMGPGYHVLYSGSQLPTPNAILRIVDVFRSSSARASLP